MTPPTTGPTRLEDELPDAVAAPVGVSIIVVTIVGCELPVVLDAAAVDILYAI